MAIADSGRQRGSVTAEFAVALPALIAVLAVAMSAVAAATAQVRCVDAARTGARAAARGESMSAALAAAKAAAPSGATVSVREDGSTARVEVHARVSLLGPIGARHATISVSAVEQAPLEPGVGGHV